MPSVWITDPTLFHMMSHHSVLHMLHHRPTSHIHYKPSLRLWVHTEIKYLFTWADCTITTATPIYMSLVNCSTVCFALFSSWLLDMDGRRIYWNPKPLAPIKLGTIIHNLVVNEGKHRRGRHHLVLLWHLPHADNARLLMCISLCVGVSQRVCVGEGQNLCITLYQHLGSFCRITQTCQIELRNLQLHFGLASAVTKSGSGEFTKKSFPPASHCVGRPFLKTHFRASQQLDWRQTLNWSRCCSGTSGCQGDKWLRDEDRSDASVLVTHRRKETLNFTIKTSCCVNIAASFMIGEMRQNLMWQDSDQHMNSGEQWV